jgi:putative membrane protein
MLIGTMKRPDWQTQGQEPDYRFTLANERTFLAWIRTALALLAGGVALDQFVGHIAPHALLAAVAIGLTLLAAFLAAISYSRWKGNEIAMRHSGPLPSSIGIPLLSAALVCVALLLMVLLFAGIR